MIPSLFSQSLFALPLDEAIDATADIGCPAIELACVAPHFSLDLARHDPERVAERIRRQRLDVSALSLFNQFSDPVRLDEAVDAAATFIGLAPLFGTRVVKLTPGAPASAEAEDLHWQCLGEAVKQLVPLARRLGVRLAFETHMRQLTDTLASAHRLLAMTPPDVVGLTVDFLNLAFAGDDACAAVASVAGRAFNTHLKNGHIDDHRAWHFQALDTGLLDYTDVLATLRQAGYDGYLTVECLQPEAETHPMATARRNLDMLARYLETIPL